MFICSYADQNFVSICAYVLLRLCTVPSACKMYFLFFAKSDTFRGYLGFLYVPMSDTFMAYLRLNILARSQIETVENENLSWANEAQ